MYRTVIHAKNDVFEEKKSLPETGDKKNNYFCCVPVSPDNSTPVPPVKTYGKPLR